MRLPPRAAAEALAKSADPAVANLAAAWLATTAKRGFRHRRRNLAVDRLHLCLLYLRTISPDGRLADDWPRRSETFPPFDGCNVSTSHRRLRHVNTVVTGRRLPARFGQPELRTR